MRDGRTYNINHQGARGRVFDAERGIHRRELNLCKTSDVEDLECGAVKAGLQKMIAETGTQVRLVDCTDMPPRDGDFGSTDWYEREALTAKDTGLGRQVSALKLDKLLREEPYQVRSPHMDVFVVGRDITPSGPGDGMSK